MAQNKADAQMILDLHGPTLTTYLAAARTPQQDLRPRFDQRGVDIDGTLRSAAMGWAIAADTVGGGYSSGRKVGEINLATGTYAPTDVDMTFPTIGLPIVIGRTYNHLAQYSNARYDTAGYQGTNWSNLAHPEIQFHAGETPATDVVYLVYGADRYIEFARVDEDYPQFKAKNGAAGLINFTDGGAGPDTFAYYDQRGNIIEFFGFDGDAGVAAGQLWRMTDTGGNRAYVGHATTMATAISSGYDVNGRITTMYDASNRRYLFAYSGSAIGAVKRLLTVTADILTSGSWTGSPVTQTVGTVAYGYYNGSGTDAAEGANGDLRIVTITMPDSVGGSQVMKKYYRYYPGPWSGGSPGSSHGIRLALAPEGVRRADLSADATLDDDYDAMSNAALASYAETGLEYDTLNRVSKAVLNGACGCAGGSGVTYYFTYDPSTGYAAAVANTTYDGAWATRTMMQRISSAAYNGTTRTFSE